MAVPRCFVCTLVERVVRARSPEAKARLFARALAYGSRVLGKGDGLATCSVCNALIEQETEDVNRERREARRELREQPDGADPLARR